MALVKVQGIVIKQTNLGEADKIITLFTDKLGKIQAVVHGARKPKSRFLSSTQMFSYCEYVLYKGKSLYTISQSDIKESFQTMLDDLYTLTYCSYITELIDTLSDNEEANVELFALLLKTFYLMTDENIDREILIRAFELKSMSISGYMPNLYRCCECRNTDRTFNILSITHGGVICSDCAERDNIGIRIDASSLNAMRFILRNGIEKVRTLKISELIKGDMKKIMKNYIKYYLDRDFKSLDFLDDLKHIDNLKGDADNGNRA